MHQFVGIILVKPDGSVLAQHRDNKPNILGPDTWAVVGGAREIKGTDLDKDLKAVAIRELHEETGYTISEKELLFLGRDQYITEKGTPVQRTFLWARYDGKQPINCNEGQEIRFINQHELRDLKIYTGHEGFLRKAMEKVFNNGKERVLSAK